MFEALLLIAIIGGIAHLANLKRRVTQLEIEVIDLRTGAAAAWRARGPGAAPEPVVAESAILPEPFLEFVEPEPAERENLYAETRPVELVEEIIPTEPHEPPAAEEPDEIEPIEEPARAFSFEELFGRKLPIWAGGITLAVAGMLIVKLSIEAGLLSPPVRVIMGSIFGFVLIGAAELALRQEERVRDARVRQALSGAGIASLYASILVAANLYDLVGPLTAMLGMAAVTALALGLSLRFGAPSALLGLAGGLAAPALIGSDEPNVPLLSLYLALAVGALCSVSRGQRWAWLGISALVGGFGWGLLLLIGGALDAPSSISIALYLMLLGVGLPMMGFAGDWKARTQLASAILAAAQMAALVATGGFAMLHWALFGMISLALQWLSTREPTLQRLPPVGLMIALLLLGAWPDPAIREFSLVAAAAALIYGVPVLLRLWRREGGLVEAGQLSAIAIGCQFIPMFHFYRVDGSTDSAFGLLALALSAIPAASAALGWQHANRRNDARFAILAISSGMLLATAGTLLLPGWAIGGAIAAVGLGLLHLGQVAEDRRLEPISWIFAAAGLVGGATTAISEAPVYWRELLRWGLLAAVATVFAWRARHRYGRIVAQFLAPLLLFGALQTIVPERWEPLMAPLLLVALAAVPMRLVPAMAAAMLVLVGWALEPVGRWVAGATPSIMGDPLFVTNVPVIDDTMIKLLIPAGMIGLSLWLARKRLQYSERVAASVAGVVLAAVAVHSLYKLLFAIGSDQAFVSFGLVERTLWEVLLLGAAALCWRLRRQYVGLALLGTATAHFIWYTLILHNPLWEAQSVGPWPVLNLVVAAYAVPALVLLAVPRIPALKDIVPARLRTICWMAVVLLFAATMLRQLFHGSLLVVPGLSQAEDIARSILAIGLAIGFLLWGIRQQDRDWRIGSLVLMLGAVAKVFLWDASGLEGLTRIASFVALGFSLIGIGWLYSRQLEPSRA